MQTLLSKPFILIDYIGTLKSPKRVGWNSTRNNFTATQVFLSARDNPEIPPSAKFNNRNAFTKHISSINVLHGLHKFARGRQKWKY